MNIAMMPTEQYRQNDLRAGITVVAPMENATILVTLETETAIPDTDNVLANLSGSGRFFSSSDRLSYPLTRTNMSSIPTPSIRNGRTL